jgi:hypothetical protein
MQDAGRRIQDSLILMGKQFFQQVRVEILCASCNYCDSFSTDPGIPGY